MLFLPLMTNLCLTSCPAITPPARKNQQPPVKGRKTINPMSASTFPDNKSIKKRSPQAVVSVDENGEFSGYFSPSDYKESKAIVKSLKSLKL